MKSVEYAKLRDIISKKSVEHYLLYTEYNQSRQNTVLKTYSVNIDRPKNIAFDKGMIKEIIRACLIDRQSGIGVAIASPSFLEAHERFYSINMWKCEPVDGKSVYKHVPDNNLFGIKEGNINPFPKTSDNLCTLELQIMGKEAELWEKVVVGRKKLEQYLHEFVKVV